MSIPTALHIFDHTIKPILLYGAEIWSPYLLSPRDLKTNTWMEKLDKHKPCQLEIKFYKRILQIKNNTPTIGIRGEIGRHPILLDALTNSIKYIETINSRPDNRLVKQALKEAANLKTSRTWHTNITTLRSHLDMTTPPNLNKKEIKKYSQTVKHQMKILYVNFWHRELNKETSKIRNKGGNKLRSYKILKQHFQMEPYLESVDNTQHRRAITRLRLSSHLLSIESMKGTICDPNQRICHMSSLQEKEDKEHFLLRCEAYTQQRQILLAPILETCTNTTKFNDGHWFTFLLTNEDRQVCKALGKYINDCMLIKQNGSLNPSTV